MIGMYHHLKHAQPVTQSDTRSLRSSPVSGARLRLRFVAMLIAVTLAIFATACASDPEPRIEDFPSRLLGTWEQVGGPAGTLTFDGTTASGIGRRSADGIAAETFTFQWVAPATIRTNIGNDVEFTVLFEDTGNTLVLAAVAEAGTDEIIRYKRRR